MTCNPLCEECEERGRITPVDDVHHIVSFMSTDDPLERLRLAFDFDNLMSLCDGCHAKKHAVGAMLTNVMGMGSFSMR